MKIKHVLFGLSTLFIIACSKDSVEPAPQPEREPEPVADASIISYFHSPEDYYQPYVYRFDEETQTWGKRIVGHFSTISQEDPTYLGFTQPYVANSGVNLFQMVTLYQAYTGTTNMKVVGINADKVLQFLPDESPSKEVSSTTGKVHVYPQIIKMYKKASNINDQEQMEFIEIGISGEGSYSLKTGVIDLEVHFDETSIGGPAKVTRKYKISKEALSL